MSFVSTGRLKQKDALEILDAMVREGAVEWDGSTKSTAIIYWRKPEEWANAIYEWIDNTGQKGSVLTLYEISEGDLTVSQGLSGWGRFLGESLADLSLFFLAGNRVPWDRSVYTSESARCSGEAGECADIRRE